MGEDSQNLSRKRHKLNLQLENLKLELDTIRSLDEKHDSVSSFKFEDQRDIQTQELEDRGLKIQMELEAIEEELRKIRHPENDELDAQEL